MDRLHLLVIRCLDFFFFFLPLLAITNNVSVNVGIVVFDVTCVFISQVDT